MKKSNSADSLTCIHTLTQSKDSVLVLCQSGNLLLFAGTQSGLIHVWQLDNFAHLKPLEGHKGHILALSVSADGRYLFSAGDEGIVRVWKVEIEIGSEVSVSINCISIIHAGPDCGDIHAIEYSDILDTIYIGCKNASIQYFDLSTKSSICKLKTLSEWKTRDVRFFKLEPLDERCESDIGAEFYLIFKEMIIPMAHHGFIYCLKLANGLPNSPHDSQFLFSGSGDGTVKIWDITSRKPNHFKTLNVSEDGSVLALTLHDGLLLTGAQGGELKVWDLETFQCIRSLSSHSNDILSIISTRSVFFTGSADGFILKWNRNFECVDRTSEHNGLVLSMASSSKYLFSGDSNNLIKIWKLPSIDIPSLSIEEHADDMLLYHLQKMIAFPSISTSKLHAEESRQCAKYLKALFVEMGADAKIVGTNDKNPLVLAKYSRTNGPSTDSLNIIIYGHYDIQPAKLEKWNFPPFQMTGHDGYLYGRGVSDNKGPVLAMLFACSELFETRNLNANVYFAIEGEEESGSGGFMEAIQQNQDFFGHIDLIILSNSYWINDDTPCLTYGLRGVIHASLEISSPVCRDLHSGVSGGAHDEPLMDTIKLLGKLKNDEHKIAIPHFYDNVHSLTAKELRVYAELVDHIYGDTKKPQEKLKIADNLISRWRNPTLTVHKIEVSGPASNTVIPRSVTAAVSMRIVPEQRLEDIKREFESYLNDCFKDMCTDNQLTINIGQTADWWLEDVLNCRYFKFASDAIEEYWKVKPQFIQEGGSIPAVPFLKKFFSASVIHIPMGQASDNAHLPNERIRLKNLIAGKEITKTFLKKLYRRQ